MTVIFKIIYFEVFLCTYDGLQKEYYIYIYIYIYLRIYILVFEISFTITNTSKRTFH
jgi:hypothetical protein